MFKITLLSFQQHVFSVIIYQDLKCIGYLINEKILKDHLDKYNPLLQIPELFLKSELFLNLKESEVEFLLKGSDLITFTSKLISSNQELLDFTLENNLSGIVSIQK